MKQIDLGKVKVAVDEYASQGNAVLGIRGSGKSYTATYCAEQLLEAGVPIVALDPIGIWRFLRVPAKKGGKAYPVVVVGGEHGDIPLTSASAGDVMRAAMQGGVSVVFDMYDMQLSKRDWRDIVSAVVKVMLYENKPYGLRHIFIEEAAEFVPQRVLPDQGVVFSMIERLVRMGGNAQLGVTLINQRAEELNKSVLDLCDLLVLHRQKGRNSLTNLAHWMDVASVTTDLQVKKEVPKLANGEAFIWPAESDSPIQTKVPAKSTYHPDRRAMREAVEVERGGTRLDADEFVVKMKKELGKVKQPAPAEGRTTYSPSLKAEYDRGFGEGEVVGIAKGRKEAVAGLFSVAEGLRTALTTLEGLRAVESMFPVGVAGHPVVKAAQRTSNAAARHNATVAGCPFPKAERLILTALAQHHPQPLKVSRVAILTGYARGGGAFRNPLGALRSKGLVTSGDPLALFDKGREAIAPFYEPLPRGEALLSYWLGNLDKPGRLILEAAAKAYPGTLTTGQLAAQAGYEAAGGAFRNALGRLRTLELVRGRGDVKASEVFFS